MVRSQPVALLVSETSPSAASAPSSANCFLTPVPATWWSCAYVSLSASLSYAGQAHATSCQVSSARRRAPAGDQPDVTRPRRCAHRCTDPGRGQQADLQHAASVRARPQSIHPALRHGSLTMGERYLTARLVSKLTFFLLKVLRRDVPRLWLPLMLLSAHSADVAARPAERAARQDCVECRSSRRASCKASSLRQPPSGGRCRPRPVQLVRSRPPTKRRALGGRVDECAQDQRGSHLTRLPNRHRGRTRPR